MGRRLMTLCVAVTLAGVAACGGGHASGPAATLASAPRTQRTTTTLTVEQQVEAAYLKSWDIYAEAMRTFDTTRLADVYVDEALKLRVEEVNGLKASNTPARMSVEHHYDIRVINDHDASVVDRYLNHSVLLDPSSGKPTERDPMNTVGSQYVLLKIDGKWKIKRVFVAS